MRTIHYKDKKLFFENYKIENAVNSFPTPFYLYSKQKLINNFLSFQQTAKEYFDMPEICFALKANSNLELLKILSSQGSGADIVSGGELIRAINAGISPKKIVFSGVGKTKDEINLALDRDIMSFNVESAEELMLINKLAKHKNKVANIALRINPKVKALTHKYISTGYKTHKFGLLEKDLLGIVNDDTFWTSSKLVGLSVHIGSQLTCLEATKKAIQQISNCANKISTKLEFIDVGGGLGVNYSNDQKPKAPTLNEYMIAIRDNLKVNYPLKIVFEPGRSIIASTGVFVSKVLRSKQSEDCHFIIVDGGMNDFARPSLYQAYHEIYPSKDCDQKIETDIVGPICETADCFGEKRMLPKLKEDDFIVIADTGAYGHSMSSNYNLRSKPIELLINNEHSLIQIRDKQNLETL